LFLWSLAQPVKQKAIRMTAVLLNLNMMHPPDEKENLKPVLGAVRL